MHRTEGFNNDNNLFKNGPPGTIVEQEWLNAVQEELANAIEKANLVLLGAATDTKDQLYDAISIIGSIGNKELYDENTILKADTDNTPIALEISEQRLLGRITGGVITSLTPAQILTLINVTAGAIADVLEDTTPQLGGNLDLNEKGLEYDFASLAADHTYSGDVITGVAGEAVALGDVCYFKSDGKFWKMDADAEATMKGMCAMATASIGAAASGIFLLRGLIRDDTWIWTVGAELFASVTPGNPTETRPTGTGDLLRLIGWAKHANYVFFDPDKTYMELK